jgi:hypothetical protein
MFKTPNKNKYQTRQLPHHLRARNQGLVKTFYEVKPSLSEISHEFTDKTARVFSQSLKHAKIKGLILQKAFKHLLRKKSLMTFGIVIIASACINYFLKK